MDRQTILDEIRRRAAAHGGQAPGADRFTSETGIREAEWAGKYWARWSDALREAGFGPNAFHAAYDEDFLLTQYIGVVRAVGRVPTVRELQLMHRADPSLPAPKTFESRFGLKQDLLKKVRAFCQTHPEHEDVREIVNAAVAPRTQDDGTPAQENMDGRVYLLRSGRYHKIGRTNSIQRRSRELAIQLPERAVIVHTIATDDPVGIEAYWHRRFADRRKNGEFFVLSVEDVRAFKRWRRI